MAKKKKACYSGIGGQAVMEGIMMRNNDRYAVAFRKPNNQIEVVLADCADEKKAKSWLVKAVKNPKGGEDILAKLRKDAAAGDEDAKKILSIVK